MMYTPNSDRPQPSRVEEYYRLHAHIYDITRWSFLFKRRELVKKTADMGAVFRILEVGCGTGKNLVALHRQFPHAWVHGVDLSESMLNLASGKIRSLSPRVELIHSNYSKPLKPRHPYDLVVFSYALSMFGTGWERAIESAAGDLKPGGCIAVVDFHRSSFQWFKTWMQCNHVCMDAHLLSKLMSVFRKRRLEIHRAYLGLWHYFLFIGQKHVCLNDGRGKWK